jgi:hypothetical protein
MSAAVGEAVIVLIALGLATVAAVVGFVVGRDSKSSKMGRNQSRHSNGGKGQTERHHVRISGRTVGIGERSEISRNSRFRIIELTYN